MTPEQQRIWNYLINNCIGYNNAQSVSIIAHACGYADHGTNNDDFRATVTDMIVNHNKPIGSSRNGYFIITTEDDRQRAINWIDRDKKVDALRNVQLYQP